MNTSKISSEYTSVARGRGVGSAARNPRLYMFAVWGHTVSVDPNRREKRAIGVLCEIMHVHAHVHVKCTRQHTKRSDIISLTLWTLRRNYNVHVKRSPVCNAHRIDHTLHNPQSHDQDAFRSWAPLSQRRLRELEYWTELHKVICSDRRDPPRVSVRCRW